MILIEKKVFDKRVWKLCTAWELKYRAEFKIRKPNARIEDYKIKIKDQIEYIRVYVAHMLIDANTRENLERIKAFLNLQKVTNSKAKLEIHFIGGSPLEIIVHVDKIQDIDIADTYGLIEFHSIHIYRKDKRWTDKSADKCYEDIKADLEFDHYEFIPSSYGYYKHDEENELDFIGCEIVEK